jgi:hypothetical protein
VGESIKESNCPCRMMKNVGSRIRFLGQRTCSLGLCEIPKFLIFPAVVMSFVGGQSWG